MNGDFYMLTLNSHVPFQLGFPECPQIDDTQLIHLETGLYFQLITLSCMYKFLKAAMFQVFGVSVLQIFQYF